MTYMRGWVLYVLETKRPVFLMGKRGKVLLGKVLNRLETYGYLPGGRIPRRPQKRRNIGILKSGKKRENLQERERNMGDDARDGESSGCVCQCQHLILDSAVHRVRTTTDPQVRSVDFYTSVTSVVEVSNSQGEAKKNTHHGIFGFVLVKTTRYSVGGFW